MPTTLLLASAPCTALAAHLSALYQRYGKRLHCDGAVGREHSIDDALGWASVKKYVSSLFLRSVPLCLKILFLAYPLVSAVAFKAFDCEDFGEAGRWLRADFSQRCEGADYRMIQILAVLGICMYPIGVPLCYAMLLFRARVAITSEKGTKLSHATRFLHDAYKPRFFWWELMEVLRRFLLVGVACVIAPGSLLQLALGEAVALVFLVVQMQAHPYKRLADGFLAKACGFSLAVFFFSCVLLKIGTLTELQAVRERLPPSLRQDFANPTVLITAVLLFSVLISLVVAAGLMLLQLEEERAHEQRKEALKHQRQLRYVRTNQPVVLPTVDVGHYHLFLSHVWSFGQEYVDAPFKPWSLTSRLHPLTCSESLLKGPLKLWLPKESEFLYMLRVLLWPTVQCV